MVIHICIRYMIVLQLDGTRPQDCDNKLGIESLFFFFSILACKWDHSRTRSGSKDPSGSSFIHIDTRFDRVISQLLFPLAAAAAYWHYDEQSTLGSRHARTIGWICNLTEQ